MDVDETINQPSPQDDDENEEEILVLVNFEESTEEYSDKELENFKILGLDSKEPILQIGSKVFGGTWQDVVGTATFFEESTPVAKKCYFSPEVPNPLKFTAKTQKSLHMKRVFVTRKKLPSDGEGPKISEKEKITDK